MPPRPSIDARSVLRLHERVLLGDCRAADEVASHLISLAPSELRRMHRVDAAIVAEAVEDAILDYLASPDKFNALKADLLRFIVIAASRNIADALRSERRRRARESAWSCHWIDVNCERGVTNERLSGVESDLSQIEGLGGDLADRHWAIVSPRLVAGARAGGGRPASDPRSVFNAILWVLRNHNARWQDLPRGYPPYTTCNRYFLAWCRAGLLRQALHDLAEDLRGHRESVSRWY